MNKDWEEQQTHLWSMPSRPKFPLEEENVKAEETIEEKEEAETKIEEEEKALQILMEGAPIKAKATTNKVDKINYMDKGMINPKSNVITVRSMAIMPLNVGKNKVTWVVDPVLILLKKISFKRFFFSM